MRKVKCEDCGKVYDFDSDDFCPSCGAFCYPKSDRAVGADGSIIRVEGISESNHKGSFLHEEYHEENRARKANGLDRGVDRQGFQWISLHSSGAKRSGTGLRWSPNANTALPEKKTRSAARTEEEELTRVAGIIAVVLILLGFFVRFLEFLF